MSYDEDIFNWLTLCLPEIKSIIYVKSIVEQYRENSKSIFEGGLNAI